MATSYGTSSYPSNVGTGSSVQKAAAAYAQQRQGYAPHAVMQEGTVTYQNGTPGAYIKYNTPQGTSTEWTPLSGYGNDYGQFNAGAHDLGGGGGGGGGVDPALAAAMNMSASIRTNAQATALAKRKAAALQYGSAEGLQGVLGNDFATLQKQAAENPYSTLANLKYGYDQGVQNLEGQLNSANLFYSGYRGDQLKDAAHQYQGSQYNAQTQYQGLQQDIADQLAQALMQADLMDMQGAQDSSYWGDSGDSGQQPYGDTSGASGQHPYSSLLALAQHGSRAPLIYGTSKALPRGVSRSTPKIAPAEHGRGRPVPRRK
jgi:hypothetical protein